MSEKLLEKKFSKLVMVHDGNLSYWQDAEKRVMKVGESLRNHREQSDMFAALDTEELELTRQVPNIKPLLLTKLASLALGFEAELGEVVDRLEGQAGEVAGLAREVVQAGAGLQLGSLTATRPGRHCLAHQLELAARIDRLYTNQQLGMVTWLQGRHLDVSVWRVASNLAQLSLLSL